MYKYQFFSNENGTTGSSTKGGSATEKFPMFTISTALHINSYKVAKMHS